MYLCFGTYATVLKQCAIKGVTSRTLVRILTQTIDPNSQYGDPNNDTQVFRLMNCQANFPVHQTAADSYPGSGAVRKSGAPLSNVVFLARGLTTTDLTWSFHEEILPLLDEGRKVQIVEALRDIIRNDASIKGEHASLFEKCLGESADELLKRKEINLPYLLAGLFLYTVLLNDNHPGKETLSFVKLRDYYINLSAYTALSINEDVNVNVKDDAENKQAADPLDGCNLYLKRVSDKYGMIKTLLYTDFPRPFYDFYVCNSIYQESQCRCIHNPDIDKLRKVSSKLILSGTGGVGKSMMLRHLLLDSVEKYDKTGLIPLFVPLKDFDENLSSLFRYIYSKLVSLWWDLTEHQLESLLDCGKFIILFDGLDEVKSKYISLFEKNLEAFLDHWPYNICIISSRPIGSFQSYNQFTVLHVLEFSKEQALELIDKLEFRPDLPSIKENFRDQFDKRLYQTHRGFADNPLLLTIMLMTFEQFAEIPSKMHIFYREAYMVLSQKHDASKGAYQRVLKTGLTSEQFADVFAEFCSRTYRDEKYEFTVTEMDHYFRSLSPKRCTLIHNKSIDDFIFDLCTNLCLMYNEGNKYCFTHRSFQEYFCALFFSQQKDKVLGKIGQFFEENRLAQHGDSTFSMLYDMIPGKVTEYIFVPYLKNLFKECDQGDGYWTFLCKFYDVFKATEGKTNRSYINPMSYS